MTLETKRYVIAGLGGLFLLSIVLVQWMETARKAEEAGIRPPHVSVPASSRECVECHAEENPGIVAHWEGSTHAEKGVGCIECHRAAAEEADSYLHHGAQIATIVTPRDCARCHDHEAGEFAQSHHAAAGNILASLDNFLAETVEGARQTFDPHSPTPGKLVNAVNGFASAQSGCQQCHGARVALEGSDGAPITVADLQPDADGRPTNLDAVSRIVRDENGRPQIVAATWPNTGIGRLNLDGSRGSCAACHSRHDFSPRRARQPENCGKCHLGPDHPQKEIYEESKHGIAYRDLRDLMNLDAKPWVLGVDYSAAPTCASCHMSGNIRNGGRVTHDPGERISWTNRPPVSLVMDTDINHGIVTEPDPEKRRVLIADGAAQKRDRMKEVCTTCHTNSYVNAFYRQYDDLVVMYNEKFAKPGLAIMAALVDNGLRTPTEFDEDVEWTWFYLWHHEGRRARHGAAMMAPDYTHWHGMYEVAERFYMGLVPQTREIIRHARAEGKGTAARVVEQVLDGVMARPEHAWFQEGAEGQAERIRQEMERRYGRDQ